MESILPVLFWYAIACIVFVIVYCLLGYRSKRRAERRRQPAMHRDSHAAHLHGYQERRASIDTTSSPSEDPYFGVMSANPSFVSLANQADSAWQGSGGDSGGGGASDSWSDCSSSSSDSCSGGGE